MKIPRYQVTYAETPNESGEEIDGILSIRTTYGIEAIKDTFEITCIDKNNSYNFQMNGRIKIYLYYEGESPVLVMDGLITEVRNEGTEKSNKVKIRGNNILEILLNHQTPADYTEKDVVYMIQNLLQRASDGQPTERRITWNSSNPTKKSDGSDFPTKNYYSTFAPVFQHIEKLSSDEYTEDGQYIFYLDQSDNTLVWKPRPTEVYGTIDYGTNTISIKRTKNADEVVNFMIINAGKDLNNATIHTYAVNPTSIGKMGWRTKYEVRESLSEFIKNMHPEITSNSEFRNIVKEFAKAWADRILKGFSDGTDKMDILVPGSTGFSAGQLYEISMPHAGYTKSNRKRLRLMEVEHNFDKGGWFSQLRFKEELS